MHRKFSFSGMLARRSKGDASSNSTTAVATSTATAAAAAAPPVIVNSRGPLELAASLLGLKAAELEKVLLSPGAGGDVRAAIRANTRLQGAVTNSYNSIISTSSIGYSSSSPPPSPTHGAATTATATATVNTTADSSSDKQQQCITVLEFPGFEKLPENTLSQLLRNTANERLHALHSELALVQPQAQLLAEGLRDPHITGHSGASLVTSAALLRVLLGHPAAVLPSLELLTAAAGSSASSSAYSGDSSVTSRREASRAYVAALYQSHRGTALEQQCLPQCERCVQALSLHYDVNIALEQLCATEFCCALRCKLYITFVTESECSSVGREVHAPVQHVVSMMVSYVTWWRCCSSDTASTASHINIHNTALDTRLHHSRGLASASLFAVKHYAGTVEYRAEGLTEANGDPALRGYIPPEVRDLLASSTRGDILQVDEVTTNLQLCMHDCSAARHSLVLSCIFAVNVSTAIACTTMTASNTAVTTVVTVADSAAVTLTTSSGSNSAPAHREGAAAACQRALDAVLLNKSLAVGRVTFALCIKPNHQLSFGVFDHRCVVEQIRSLNLVSLCHTMRTGASTSISYSEIDALYRPQLKSAVSRLASVRTPKLIAQHGYEQSCKKLCISAIRAEYAHCTMLYSQRSKHAAAVSAITAAAVAVKVATDRIFKYACTTYNASAIELLTLLFTTHCQWHTGCLVGLRSAT
eukprot:10388-Heterococcus_DN1.PRE.1